jgi:dihydroorotase
MSLEEIIPRVTANPARVLAHHPRTAGIGTLQPGSPADVAVLDVVDGDFPLVDSFRQERRAPRRIVNVATIRAGDLVWHAGAPSPSM